MLNHLAFQRWGIRIDAKPFVWTRRIVDPITAYLSWQTYDKAFREVNLKTPCRQSFHFDEFLGVMFDSDFFKVFLFVDGKPVGLAIITVHLEKLPWINAGFFAQKYPDLTVGYVPTIVVHPEYQGGGKAKPLMDELHRLAVDVFGCNRLGMDHSVKVNGFLPKMIIRAFGGRVLLDGEPIDQQSYVFFKRADFTALQVD